MRTIHEAAIDSTPIALMDKNEIDMIIEYVRNTQSAPVGLNQSYLYEIAISEMMEVFYTKNDSLSDVFYGYYIDNGVAIEDWAHDDESFINNVKHLVNLHPDGEVLFAFDSQNTGNQFNWSLTEKLGEMHCCLGDVKVSDSCTQFTTDRTEEVVDILAGGWWNHRQAQNFVETTTHNPNSVTRLIVTDTTVGFAHAAYDDQSAWINTVFVEEESRGQGFGKKLVTSLLAALKQIGVANAYLGVDKNNEEATSLYTNIGFKFTPFEKWQFKVTKTDIF